MRYDGRRECEENTIKAQEEVGNVAERRRDLEAGKPYHEVCCARDCGKSGMMSPFFVFAALRSA